MNGLQTQLFRQQRPHLRDPTKWTLILLLLAAEDRGLRSLTEGPNRNSVPTRLTQSAAESDQSLQPIEFKVGGWHDLLGGAGGGAGAGPGEREEWWW